MDFRASTYVLFLPQTVYRQQLIGQLLWCTLLFNVLDFTGITSDAAAEDVDDDDDVVTLKFDSFTLFKLSM